jgi:hypothetical protein
MSNAVAHISLNGFSGTQKETPTTGIVEHNGLAGVGRDAPTVINKKGGITSKTDEDIYYAMSDREKALYIKANPDWPRSVGWTQTRWAASEIEKINLNDLVDYFEWIRRCPGVAARHGAAGITMLGSDYKERKPMTPIESVEQGSAVRNGLSGVGPDAPIVTNEQGGKQSKVQGRFDLLPPLALIGVAKVLGEGATKYGEDNWRLIKANSHINHAICHLLAFLAHDTQDAHLEHASCRILMALEMHILEKGV